MDPIQSFFFKHDHLIFFSFSKEVDSKSAQNKVFGIIVKIPVPFHLPNDDGCTLGISCPIKAGSTIQESVTLPILAEYPKVIYLKA
jgi:hypothetical protein